jgi:Prokaryotic N-terminal methylation motif
MSSHRRSQAGLSIVELIVGMAITSILMLGITGVVFSANTAYSGWIDRIETSGTGDVLAAELAADSHRYVACSKSVNQLDFCIPGASGTAPVVSYRTSGTPYSVMRVASPSDSRVVVRNLDAPLKFRVTCAEAKNVDFGFISVAGLPGRVDLRVYFQAAIGECENVSG